MSDQDETIEEQAPPLPPVPEPVAPPAPVYGALGDEEVERRIHAMSRRSFLWTAVAVAGVAGAREWLITRRPDSDIPWPFRTALEFNEGISRDYFRSSRLAPTFPASDARMPFANGAIGMDEDLDPDSWKLTVEGVRGKDRPIDLTLHDIKALPRFEVITELKCIEGWTTVVHWTGARFADFIAKYPPATSEDDSTPTHDKKKGVQKLPTNLADQIPYVALETPGGEYYVGLDMESALQPQTLLCYEMNGEPLTDEHGAPLRLAIPVKYGIKNIKRIGTIRYSTQRPNDYWAEQGYDWYAGH